LVCRDLHWNLLESPETRTFVALSHTQTETRRRNPLSLGYGERGYRHAMELTTPYTLPDLPYAVDALEPTISSRIMELHHGTHHAAYVKGANEISEKISSLSPGEDPGALSRSLAFNLSGHFLHSLFWTSMSPNGGGEPVGDLSAAINESFGDVSKLIDRMSATIEKLSGSGWATLSWDELGRRLVVSQIHDHQHDHAVGLHPLLVIDGWEHAYYLQYEAAKAKWARAFWDIADWSSAGNRLTAVMAIGEARSPD
jgi:superoxide dismutase, Fe-Mn family